jgi:DMSO/TMAO reductase YedYZ heme-binding membrane subunit
MLAIEAGFVLFMIGATRGRRWSEIQRLALVAGGLAVYALFGIFTDRALHGAADMLPHAFIILFFVVITFIAGLRVRSAEAAGSGE